MVILGQDLQCGDLQQQRDGAATYYGHHVAADDLSWCGGNAVGDDEDYEDGRANGDDYAARSSASSISSITTRERAASPL